MKLSHSNVLHNFPWQPEQLIHVWGAHTITTLVGNIPGLSGFSPSVQERGDNSPIVGDTYSSSGHPGNSKHFGPNLIHGCGSPCCQFLLWSWSWSCRVLLHVCADLSTKAAASWVTFLHFWVCFWWFSWSQLTNAFTATSIRHSFQGSLLTSVIYIGC